jgi:hypothetical protein
MDKAIDCAATPNPRRQAAGRANRAKRGPLTPAGRKRLRASIRRTQPWRQTRGPITPAGKVRSAANGKVRQKGPLSTRAVRAQLQEARQLIEAMREARALC